MLNRKSVSQWAGGSTRRSAIGAGFFGGMRLRVWACNRSGGVLEGDFLAGQAFQLGDEVAFALLRRGGRASPGRGR
jgi:hypothetical protein